MPYQYGTRKYDSIEYNCIEDKSNLSVYADRVAMYLMYMNVESIHWFCI